MSVTKSKSSVTNIERDQKRTQEGWTATADGTKDYLMFLNNMAILLSCYSDSCNKITRFKPSLASRLE